MRGLTMLLEKSRDSVDRTSELQETTTSGQKLLRGVTTFGFTRCFIVWLSALPRGVRPHQVCQLTSS